MIEVRYSVIVTAGTDEEADNVGRYIERAEGVWRASVTVLELSREEVTSDA